jgi:hypothetical protein
MASSYPPKKNTSFTLHFTLYKNDGTVILVPGTAITKKISKDGGAAASIGATVVHIDENYGMCSLVISATEMNADIVDIYIVDDTADCVPFTCSLYTTAYTLDDIGASLALVLGDTAELQTDWTNSGRLDLLLDAVKAKTDNLPASPAAVGSAMTLAADQAVNVTKIAGAAVSTTTAQLGVNVVQVSGDSTAADNLESYCDGTTPQPVNVTQISGDSTSADTLESYTDGTTAMPVNMTQIAGSAVSATTAQLGVNVVNWKGSVAAAMTGDAFARLGAPAGASVSADVAAVKVDTAATVTDTNELQTEWADGGRLDLLLDGAASAGDPWTTNLPGSYTGSQAGYIIGTNLDAKVSDGDTTQVALDTTEILTRLPDATPGAAGGLFIAGTNAATTITSATAHALTLSASGANKSGLVVTGNGSGAGVSVAAGITGTGLLVNGGVTSGDAVNFNSQDGSGLILSPGDNHAALKIIGQGTGPGIEIVGGSTGAGITVTGGDTSGNGITISTTSGDGISALVSSALANQIADAHLNRDMSAVSDTTSRSPLNALRMIRNKVSMSGGVMTITKEDDSTTAWTAEVTSDAAAEPITGVNPT